jgi:hypothetical protein
MRSPRLGHAENATETSDRDEQYTISRWVSENKDGPQQHVGLIGPRRLGLHRFGVCPNRRRQNHFPPRSRTH